jgi:hypothetical protein
MVKNLQTSSENYSRTVLVFCRSSLAETIVMAKSVAGFRTLCCRRSHKTNHAFTVYIGTTRYIRLPLSPQQPIGGVSSSLASHIKSHLRYLWPYPEGYPSDPPTLAVDISTPSSHYHPETGIFIHIKGILISRSDVQHTEILTLSFLHRSKRAKLKASLAQLPQTPAAS